MTDKDNKKNKGIPLSNAWLFRRPDSKRVQQDEKETMDLDQKGEELLEAALEGDADRIVELVAEGVDVNYYSPKSGSYAICLAAASSAWPATEELLKAKGIKVLVKDRLGRLPSTLAGEVSYPDTRLAAILMEYEIEEAERAGLEYKDVLTGKVGLNRDPQP